MSKKIVFNSIYLLFLGVFLQISGLQVASQFSFAGPKKVTQNRADRFIPERVFDGSALALQEARLDGFFDSSADDLTLFLYQDVVARSLFGVGYEEGKRGGILYHSSVPQHDVKCSQKLVDLLRQRDYHSSPNFFKNYDAPGFISDFYSKTFAGTHKKFALALQSFDEETGGVTEDLYLLLSDGDGESRVEELDTHLRGVSFLKWVTPTRLLVGSQTGVWAVYEIEDSGDIQNEPIFNSDMGAQLGLGRVTGAHDLPSTQKLLVGFEKGALVEFDLQDLRKNRTLFQVAQGILTFEFSSQENYLAIGTVGNGVFIYEWPSLKLSKHIPMAKDTPTKALSWHPQKNRLLLGTGINDHRVIIYSLDHRKIIFEKDVQAQVRDLIWSKSGSEVVVALGDLPRLSQVRELETYVLVWAVVGDGDQFMVKALSGLPPVTDRVMSVYLDEMNAREKAGYLLTQVFALTAMIDGRVSVLDFSSRKSKQETQRSSGLEDLSGFMRKSFIR